MSILYFFKALGRYFRLKSLIFHTKNDIPLLIKLYSQINYREKYKSFPRP